MCSMCSPLFCFASHLLGKSWRAPPCSQSYHSLGLREEAAPPSSPARYSLLHRSSEKSSHLPTFPSLHTCTDFLCSLHKRILEQNTPLLPVRDQFSLLRDPLKWSKHITVRKLDKNMYQNSVHVCKVLE